jgi:glycosyltransferase involved in cell wall biosynthesis
MRQKLIFIGPCGGGDTPKNGASAKNYHLVRFMQGKGIGLDVIDTEKWRKNPAALLKLFLTALLNPKGRYIVATNNMSAYRVIRVLKLLPGKRKIIYWVIGGTIANWIKNGKVKADPYKSVEWFLVEGKKMQKTFAECGFENVLYVPNFKHINHIPEVPDRNNGIVKFVFLSRIIPQKGCNIILRAVEKLNSSYRNKYSVDFWGPIEDGYAQEFKSKIEVFDNVHYRGFLDLLDDKNYDELAKYNAMLFPTFWDGEGFPGIIIDAFISGLPVIATDWSLNSDIIEEGKTGIIVKIHPLFNSENTNDYSIDEEYIANELASAMSRFIENPDIVGKMALNCRNAASRYVVENVLTKELFKKIGIEL